MHKYIFLLLLLIPLSGNLLSKNNNPKYDNELWSFLSIDIELVKHLEFNYENEFRINKNISEFQQDIQNFGLSYDITKFWDAGIISRFRFREDVTEYDLIAQSSVNFDIKPVEFDFRLRFQKKFLEEGFEEDYLREKLSIRYQDFKDFEPFINGELFYKVNGAYSGQFEKMRLYAGLNFDLPDKQEITLQYIYEHEFDVPKPLRSNILSVGYKVSFN